VIRQRFAFIEPLRMIAGDVGQIVRRTLFISKGIADLSTVEQHEPKAFSKACSTSMYICDCQLELIQRWCCGNLSGNKG
jgi:hypothetical protein